MMITIVGNDICDEVEGGTGLEEFDGVGPNPPYPSPGIEVGGEVVMVITLLLLG